MSHHFYRSIASKNKLINDRYAKKWGMKFRLLR